MFCTACGAAMPADAKFCPKCGAAAGARPGTVPPPASAPAPPPKPAPQPASATAPIDLASPKSQAEIACGIAAIVFLIFGFVTIANSGGNAWALFFGFLDVALGALALQAVLHSRKGKFAPAAQMALFTAVGSLVLGVLAMALFGGAGGSSLVICLLLMAATGFAYWRFSKM